MTAYASNASGNWSTTTIWTPTAPTGGPASGDTVVIGHAVTVDVNSICGISGAIGQTGTGTVTATGTTTLAGSGTSFSTQLRIGDRIFVAGVQVWVTAIASNTSLTMSSGQTFSGQTFTFDPAAMYLTSAGALIIASSVSLTLRGIGTINDGTITLNAGASLLFDAHLASPTTQTYALYIGIVGLTNAHMTCNGSSGSHCVVQSNAGGGNGYIPGVTTGNGNITATYTDFSRIGDATNVNNHYFFNGAVYSFDHCTFDSCGEWHGSNDVQSTDTFNFNTCVWTNSLGSNSLYVTANNTATGTRQIVNCVFDGRVSMIPTGLTLTGNYFGGGFVVTDGTLGNEPAIFSGNFIRENNTTNTIATLGDITDCYVYWDESNAANPHYLVPMNNATSVTYDRILFQCAKSDGIGDCILVSATGTGTARKLTVQHCIELPDAAGENSGTLITSYGTAAISIDCIHNTYIMGIQGTAYGEDPGTGFTGFTDQWRHLSNIAWDTSQRGYILVDGTEGSAFNAAANTVKTSDYNIGWNFKTTYGVGGTNPAYLANGYPCSNTTNPFHSAPGSNDLHINPNFVDYTRSLATFDSQYLGNTATAWVTAHSYAVGDMVSVTTTGVWYGVTVNYRCISAHASVSGNSTTGLPGTALSWTANWELASQYRLRTAIANSTTITDATLGLTGATMLRALNEWVRAGFAPTNTASKVSGHDGQTPGAVAYQSSATALILSITTNTSNQPVLVWTALSGAVNYLIYRYPTQTSAPTSLATVSAPTTTYTDTSPLVGTSYYAVVATF